MARAWSACDLTFELAPQENPQRAELRAEFRSPRFKTYLLRAFLEDRFGPLPEALQERIAEATDLELLQRACRQAIHLEKLADLNL